MDRELVAHQISPVGEAPASEDADDHFIEEARDFLARFGVNRGVLDPDADLVASGVLDSLLLLAFFAFVQEKRGPDAKFDPQDVVAMRTLRRAGEFARGARTGR